MADQLRAGAVRCTVTRYLVRDGEVVETTGEETTSCQLREVNGQRWLYLGNSEASGPVEHLLAGARLGRGWLAQAGTMPYLDEYGRVGGKNYPEIYVSAAALLEVLGP